LDKDGLAKNVYRKIILRVNCQYKKRKMHQQSDNGYPPPQKGLKEKRLCLAKGVKTCFSDVSLFHPHPGSPTSMGMEERKPSKKLQSPRWKVGITIIFEQETGLKSMMITD
jgi:hypothetical protein